MRVSVPCNKCKILVLKKVRKSSNYKRVLCLACKKLNQIENRKEVGQNE